MEINNQWQTVVIVGAQWGDEGKGKVTDYYGYQTDFVVDNFLYICIGED